MTTTKTKKPSKAILKKSAKLLQVMHDYIEEYGFDISVPASKRSNNYDLGKKGKVNVGPVCYIGGARLAAGVNPYEFYEGTDKGNGEELTIALRLLDKIALRTKKGKKATGYNLRGSEPGGIVEALGFLLRNEGVTEAKQKAYALTLLRRALRDIYKEIG